MCVTVPIKCPNCGKILLYVDDKAHGHIYPFCKRCKKTIEISLERASEPT